MPRYVDKLRLHTGTEIFSDYGIEEELQQAIARQVWLPSGGYLIIDQTEALTSIDVNTGHYVGRKNLRDHLEDGLKPAKKLLANCG